MSYSSPPPPPGYGGQQPYGYGGQQPQTTSGLAIAALVTGIIGIPLCGFFVFSIAAIVLGFLGRNDVAKSHGAKKGSGMALAGLICGAVALTLAIVINALVLTGVLDINTRGM